MRTAPSKLQGQRDSARSEAALVKGIEHFVHHLSLQKGSCEMPGVRQSRNSCIMLPPNLPFNPSLCIMSLYSSCTGIALPLETREITGKDARRCFVMGSHGTVPPYTA